MVLRSILMLLLLLPCICFNAQEQAVVGGKQETKKIGRMISGIWPGQKILIKRTATEKGTHDTYPIVATLFADDSLTGYLFIGRCKSKYNDFEFALCTNASGDLKGSTVLTYREDYGSEVCSGTWLRQFTDKDTNDEWAYGKDISAISGATISATHLSNAIHRAMVWMKQKINEEQHL